MAFEHKPGTFSLFKNDRKQTDSHPDYTGNGKDLDGRPIRVAAWINEGAKGKFMSCKFSESQEQRSSEPRQQEAEIPF